MPLRRLWQKRVFSKLLDSKVKVHLALAGVNITRERQKPISH